MHTYTHAHTFISVIISISVYINMQNLYWYLHFQSTPQGSFMLSFSPSCYLFSSVRTSIPIIFNIFAFLLINHLQVANPVTTLGCHPHKGHHDFPTQVCPITFGQNLGGRTEGREGGRKEGRREGRSLLLNWGIINTWNTLISNV